MKEEESILRFLNDEMDDEELTSFNKRMIHEPELAESVDHSRRIKNILNDDTVEFSNKVRAVIESKRKKKSFTSLLVAASTVIVLAASIYFLFLVLPRLKKWYCHI